MLVESPDGQRALLGRNKKFTAGMYTCLSGFIDQSEGIEEVGAGVSYVDVHVHNIWVSSLVLFANGWGACGSMTSVLQAAGNNLQDVCLSYNFLQCGNCFKMT